MVGILNMSWYQVVVAISEVPRVKDMQTASVQLK